MKTRFITYFRAAVAGGRRLQENGLEKGAFAAPTVFTECTDEMLICREEIFGPVMSILGYTTEAEVPAHTNNTGYGLAAGVVAPDLQRAHRIAGKLRADICRINAWGESPAQIPAGGYRQSGIGRENGIQTLSTTHKPNRCR